MNTLSRVGWRGGVVEGFAVKRTGNASSADLGNSSKYSNETFEGRSGERFLKKSNSFRVSRS